MNTKQARRFVAFDQHGRCFQLRTSTPRKELLKLFGLTNCTNMYRDAANGYGSSQHVGYVIGTAWIEVFEIIPFKQNQEQAS